MIAASGPGSQENPKDDLTYREIASRVGVPERTLHKWKSEQAFQDFIRDCGTADRTSTQIEAMLVEQSLNKKSERHAKLWIDKYGPQNAEKESRFETIFGLSQDELEEIRQSFYRHYKAVMETVPNDHAPAF